MNKAISNLLTRLEALEEAKGAGLTDEFWRDSYEAAFRMLTFDPQSEPTPEARAAYEAIHGTADQYLASQKKRLAGREM